MSDKTDRLQKLDNHKLIDVVRNYRQYGYDEELRQAAIDILQERGIDEEQLRLAGQFENQTYEAAGRYFASFRQNSKIAFALYLIVFSILYVVPIFVPGFLSGLPLLVISLLLIAGYLIYLFKSFFDQDNFYKTIGKKEEADGVLLYLVLGLPFYAFLFFYFTKRMKEQMKRIR